MEKERQISPNSIFRLSDFISSTFFDGIETETIIRKNIVLYNPKKGVEFTQKIMDTCPEFEWIALQNMSHEEMKQTMLTSKVYIDFGNHPGKDRIPREAALCGCCVITGKRGSAKNDVDVKIPPSYKFDDNNENLFLIKRKIQNCLIIMKE